MNPQPSTLNPQPFAVGDRVKWWVNETSRNRYEWRAMLTVEYTGTVLAAADADGMVRLKLDRNGHERGIHHRQLRRISNPESQISNPQEPPTG